MSAGSERALEESEQRLRLATDAARIGIWDRDIDRDAVIWTPEVYDLHGIHLWARIQQAVATARPQQRSVQEGRGGAARRRPA